MTVTSHVAWAITPPQAAIDAGYTRLALWDTFENVATIDLDNTKVAGYKWYIAPPFGVPTPLKTDFVQSGSLLTITGSTSSSSYRPRLSTCGYTGSGTNKTWVGNSIPGGGFYAECSFACNPALGNSNQNGWPSFWCADRIGIGAQTPTFQGYAWSELDIIELVPVGGLGNGIIQHTAAEDWVEIDDPGQGGGGFGNFTLNSNFDASAVIPATTTAQTKYGSLYIPAAQNAGTGLVQRYVNRTHYSALDITWTTGSGFLHKMDQVTDFIFFIEGGPSWPTAFDYVAIWVAP